MNRRELLAALASASIPLGFARIAQADNGAKVYGDYTQAELDASMDQARWAPNMQVVLAKWKPQSEQARKTLRVLPPAKYGDLRSRKSRYSRRRSRTHRSCSSCTVVSGNGQGIETSAFPALSLVPAGCAFVNVGFRAAPQSTLVDMADDVQNAFLWTVKNAASFGGDANRIFVVGHSSGAHLAAVLLTRDLGGSNRLIRGATLLSGLYELEPVLLSARREWVKLTPQQSADLSPLRHIDRSSPRRLLCSAARNRPSFSGRDACSRRR